MRRVVGGLVFLGLALLTSARVSIWHNNRTLWTDAARRAPEKPRTILNLASALINTNRFAEAETMLERGRALSLARAGWERDHGEDIASANLVILRMRQGRADEAQRLMTEALAGEKPTARAGTELLMVCQAWGPCPKPEPR